MQMDILVGGFLLIVTVLFMHFNGSSVSNSMDFHAGSHWILVISVLFLVWLVDQNKNRESNSIFLLWEDALN